MEKPYLLWVLLLWYKYLQSEGRCYLHHYNNCWGCTAWVVNPEGWEQGCPPS